MDGCLIASPLFYYCCRVALQSAAIRQIELVCYMHIHVSSVLMILGKRVGSLQMDNSILPNLTLYLSTLHCLTPACLVPNVLHSTILELAIMLIQRLSSVSSNTRMQNDCIRYYRSIVEKRTPNQPTPRKEDSGHMSNRNQATGCLRQLHLQIRATKYAKNVFNFTLCFDHKTSGVQFDCRGHMHSKEKPWNIPKRNDKIMRNVFTVPFLGGASTKLG